MTPQLQMLQKMFKLIIEKEQKNKADAYERLLSVIAGQFYFETPINIEWINKELHEELVKMFDVELLRKKRFDWIGELHKVEKINLFDNKSLITEEDLAGVPTMKLRNKHYPYRILDRNCGTGRMLLHHSAKLKTDCVFYATEENLTAYRVALLNAIIYEIPSSILCVDSNTYDIRPHSPNWRLTNTWEPEARFMIKEEEVNERTRPNKDGLVNIV